MGIVTHGGPVMPYGNIEVNVCSGDGLLPKGTKPSPDTMRDNQQAWTAISSNAPLSAQLMAP